MCRADGVEAQIGFSSCFPGHLFMASPFVCDLKILKTSLNFTKRFPKERPQMIAAIVWFPPKWTQLRKYAAADIVPSLTSLTFSWIQVETLCLNLQKIPSNQNIKSSKVATFEIVTCFLTTISHTYGTIKPPWRAPIVCDLLSNVRPFIRV